MAPPVEPSAGPVILIVDDDEGVRALLARVLRDAGHCVLTAATAEAGLRLVQHPEDRGYSRIDLLVTNTMLPQIPGAELARRAQAVRPGLAVLHVTGHPRAFPPEQCRRATDRHVLRKPFGPDELLHAVTELLDRP